ncbi:hypothetical protein CO174_04665 [Candidatus Uhrbacteria bacterium CG_4_9_14_3_um_filter_50_9]|uniref:O-antigen ligase-related domain-containing protein n=1 Tax=Candidatus Uhrbacteria bacterium CG_4_9_14_3_um_filter_50_9 TaxID=1975035 RepID=A0A2M7XB45_9BACT|nr:MAG: hypothetical protein CO174_04665 [Candidatus Uhrbacteria bacterium CG_4_9_14_3_um_filter_50_9]
MKLKLFHIFFSLSVFLLPWQTRYIFHTLSAGEGMSEYGVLSIYVVEILVVLAYLLRGRLQLTPGAEKLLKAVMVTMGAVFFSLALSHVVTVGWFHVLHVLTAFLLFSLVLDERTSLNRLSFLLALGLVGPSLLGVCQVATGSSGASTLLGLATKDVAVQGVAVVETATSRMMRAYGSFPHPNIFGGYVAVALMMLAWSIRSLTSKRLLWLVGSLVVLLSATLTMTFSRSAWFGLLSALVLLVAQMLWIRKMPPSRAVPLMTLGLVSVLITLGIFHNQLLARFNPSLHVEATSIEERASQYTSFNDVYFTSTLVGVGPGGYVFALESLDPGHEAWSYQPIHNTFLLLMAEVGMLGFVLAARVIWLLWKQLRLNRRRAGGVFGTSLLALLFVVGFFDHYLWSLWPGLALSALALGCVARYSFEETKHF